MPVGTVEITDVAESCVPKGDLVSDVRVLARWSGWCDPCETERPLILTESGERGLRAWLHGVGHEDRALTLTCGVCGSWQSVDHDDEDDVLDDAAPSPLAALHSLGARQLVLVPAAAPFQTYPKDVPRAIVTMPATSPEATLDLVAEGLDLISVAS